MRPSTRKIEGITCLGILLFSLLQVVHCQAQQIPAGNSIHGTVTDADTGKPIERFTVISAYVPWMSAANLPVRFNRQNAVEYSKGKYDFPVPSRIASAPPAMVLRFEASGYIAEQSPFVRVRPTGIEDTEVNIKLRSVREVKGIVKLPGGEGAAGARLVFCSHTDPVLVENGVIIGQPRSVTTDESGRFSLTPDTTDLVVLVLHDRGIAIVKEQELTGDSVIKLNGWARVEGIARSKLKASGGSLVAMTEWTIPGPPLLSFVYQTKAAEDGRFVFDRVLAPASFAIDSVERTMLGRSLAYVVRPELSASPVIQTFPGETTRFETGTNGRSVIGRIHRPVRMGTEDLDVRTVVIWTLPPQIARPRNYSGMTWQRKQAVDKELMSTPEYHSYLRSRRTHVVPVKSDGTFRLDGVEPGEYRMMPERMDGIPVQQLEILFKVPPITDKVDHEPLDLGNARFSPAESRE